MLARVPRNSTHLVRNTSPTKPLYSKLGKPTDKALVELIGKNWTTVVVWVAVLSVTLRIFRCGGRTNLTFFDWIRQHTIYGDKIQYVPEEDYMEELR